VGQFKIFIEDHEGWRLLWNDDKTPKKEIAFQALLSGILTGIAAPITSTSARSLTLEEDRSILNLAKVMHGAYLLKQSWPAILNFGQG